MKEARFISQNREKWKKMENWQALNAERLAANFIELSDDLAYARTFYPDSRVVPYLNQLLAAYQGNIHARAKQKNRSVFYFWTHEMPSLLASKYRTLLFACCFFLFSVGIGVFSAAHEESFVRLILGDTYVNMTLENIRSGTPMGVYAQGKAWEMFLQILVNNVRVAFLAFAYGLFFSAGTLWILFQNGVMLGTFHYLFFKYGLLLHSSLSIWAHGTFEITAIVVAGAAGLIMGNSFLFPGTYPRLYSFQQGAMHGMKMVAGLVPFFILAAFVESYITRYADATPAIGGFCVALSLIAVIAYFLWLPWVFRHKRCEITANLDI